MSLGVAICLFIIGLFVVIYFAEKLLEGAVGTSIGFGVSAFIISVVFIGFDPENLAVGAVATSQGMYGTALGSIIGGTMVAGVLSFGITALVTPMRFAQAPGRMLMVPILSVVLLSLLAADGLLSRLDGGVLLVGFVAAIFYMLRLSRRGIDIRPSGEVAESLEEAGETGRWKALGLLIGSVVAIVVGSEMLVRGAEVIVGNIGLTETFFGMVIISLLVSIEELARELPAAIQGRPEISFGNVAGSILAFFLFNAGIIALVNPVTVNSETLFFYLPICLLSVLLISIFMSRRFIPRWAGALFILVYLSFAIGGYLI